MYTTYVKNIFFLLPFVMNTAFCSDGNTADFEGLFSVFNENLYNAESTQSYSLEQFSAKAIDIAPLLPSDIPPSALPEEQSTSFDFSLLRPLLEPIDSSSSSSGSLHADSDVPTHSVFERYLTKLALLPLAEKIGDAYLCPISGCNKKSESLQKLEAHLNTHGTPLQIYCIFCGTKIRTQNRARSHQCVCKQKNCPKIYNGRLDAVKHMANHTREEHQEFASSLGLQEESDLSPVQQRSLSIPGADRLPSALLDGKTITCPICRTCTTKSLPYLNKHMRTIHPDKDKVKCPKCEQIIHTRNYLLTHTCKAQSPPDFTENYLTYYPSAKQSSDLPELLNVEENDKHYYTCPYCHHFKGINSSTLEKHIATRHYLARNKECSGCARILYTQEGFSSHKCSNRTKTSRPRDSSTEQLETLKRHCSASQQHNSSSSSSSDLHISSDIAAYTESTLSPIVETETLENLSEKEYQYNGLAFDLNLPYDS